MKVFFNGRLIVIESNIAWALPYWQKRRLANKSITWKIEGKLCK